MKKFYGFESGEYVPCNENVKKYVNEYLKKDIELFVDDFNRIWTEADEYLGDVEKIELE